jgi:glutamate---cysteine ligase / carboxylate-amine ligase
LHTPPFGPSLLTVERDLDTARSVFESSTDFTVGLEEEFAILDPDSLEMVGRFEELRDSAAITDPGLAEAISGELIASEIEIRSGRGEDLAAARAAQQDFRRRLFAHAASRGAELGSTGTHAFSDYRRQTIIPTEHYRRVEQGLQYVAWRNNTFALHVHVGIRGAERAIAVCDRLRPVLPVLLAISASSPFLDGRDSGLHSARTQTFTKSFPRCGVPDPFGDWSSFAEYIAWLYRTGSIVEYTQVWWSIRPHLTFGTVEVRICDAQPTAGESDALSALIAACVAQAARDHDEGVPAELIAGRLIEENLWRAIRYGLDGELIDLRSGELYPAAAAGERLLSWTAPVREELGIDVTLPAQNGAQRQRRLIEEGLGPHEVYARLQADTRETYSRGAPDPASAMRGR